MNIKQREQFRDVLMWDCKEILVVNSELRRKVDEFRELVHEKELFCPDECRAYIHLLTANYIFERYKYVHISNGRFVFGVDNDGRMDLLFSSKLHQSHWLK